ncbi:MAG: DUF427 domain-containing protein [Gammaproteobacteria bacterium]|jgi:uncharacterized protein (DUF427 family)
MDETKYECYPSPKWIRGYFNGRLIVDSRRAVLLRPGGSPPAYYFPKQDIAMDCLVPSKVSVPLEENNAVCYWDIQVGERQAEQAAVEYLRPKAVPMLAGYLMFNWSAMDNWFEEQEEVFIHPRDPRVRIDVLQSTRHIRIIIDHTTVAETHNPVLLFETGLPVRYYIPKTDVQLELLVGSDHVTYCPYKGEAHYYSIETGDNIVPNVAWYYQYPVIECAKIASHIAFYQERVGGIEVDGQWQAAAVQSRAR